MIPPIRQQYGRSATYRSGLKTAAVAGLGEKLACVRRVVAVGERHRGTTG